MGAVSKLTPKKSPSLSALAAALGREGGKAKTRQTGRSARKGGAEAENTMSTTKKPLTLTEFSRLGGKVGGKAKTPAKIAAVRQNGRQGGRPRKGPTCSRCGVEWETHQPCR